MGGNCDTGSSGIEIAPASVIRIATTVANTGRSMKKATKPGARGAGGAGCGGSEGGADTDLQQRRREERAFRRRSAEVSLPRAAVARSRDAGGAAGRRARRDELG